jgi:hypothetical protein
MLAEIKQHIELQGDDPLDAIVDGHPRVKAYLVAQLAMVDGVEAAVEQYKHFNLSAAAVYAALSFYHDNLEAIREADAKVMEALRQMGARDSQEVREEILRRQQKKSQG